MASSNPFDLLRDDDNDDPSQLIAVQQQKVASKKQQKKPSDMRPPAKLPTKPPPPTQAVKEARINAAVARGVGGQGPRRDGRAGGYGQYKDSEKENVGGYGYGPGGGAAGEERDAARELDRDRGSYGRPRQPYRGGRRGGYANVEDAEHPPRRMFERHSGTGRGNEIKRDGSGRGNWGAQTDYVTSQETEEVVKRQDKGLSDEKQPEEDVPIAQTKEVAENATEEIEKQEEDKEMTLEEYEKIREEKRKSLLATRTKERKVDVDNELKSMQQLSMKKGNDEIFIKLGSNKDSKKLKDNERDERSKKSVSINEFLKPADGGRNYSTAGRGRGRGRGDRGPYRGADGGRGNSYTAVDIKIEDPGQFPALGGK